MQPVEASVNIFDQMTDDEQKVLLAALAALKAAGETVMSSRRDSDLNSSMGPNHAVCSDYDPGVGLQDAVRDSALARDRSLSCSAEMAGYA